MSVEQQIKLLKSYDSAYFEGAPLVDDSEYDALKQSIEATNGEHPYFGSIGAPVASNKVKLPHKLGSLNQLRTDAEIARWISNFGADAKTFIVTPKLDGVSCLAHYTGSKFTTAYSRGDGHMGQNITNHLSHISNVPSNITTSDEFYVRGELITRESVFNQHYSGTYARALNMVSGNVNSKTPNSDIFAHVDFVAYEMVVSSYDNSKSETLNVLKRHGFDTVSSSVVDKDDMSVETLSTLFKKFQDEMDYALDGIVVTVNEYDAIDELFRDGDINPIHSFKYKELDQSAIFETRVKDVHWNISKHGALKPRVEIDPVVIYSSTVTYATGFNAKFIEDNGIGEGAIIKITKSGTVIPFILEVVKGVAPKMPDCAWDWNDTNVDAIAVDGGDDVTIKQLSHFFTTLDVEQLRETSIIKVFEYNRLSGKSFDESVGVMFNMISAEWKRILGENGVKIYNSLHQRLSHLNEATLIGALPYFGIGFGVRRAKKIFEQHSMDSLFDLTLDEVKDLEGFNDITAMKLLDGLPLFQTFYNEHKNYIEFQEDVVVGDVLTGVVVVMSGFRDKELSAKIEQSGGKVVSGVSSKITHLIVSDVNSTTSKITKARSLDKEIVNVNDFKQLYNL